MYYKSIGGGFFKRLCQLMSACANRGTTVHYLAPAPFPPLKNSPNIVWHKAWIFGPEPLQKLLCIFILPMQALTISSKYKIDQIAVFGSAYAAVNVLSHFLLNIPIITFLRGAWIKELKHKRADCISILAAHIMNKIGLHCSNVVVANSKHMVDSLAEQGIDDDRIAFLPNNIPPTVQVDRHDAGRKLRETYDLSTDSFVISYVGTFKTMKRTQIAVDILAALKNTRAALIIAGDGPNKEKIRQRINELDLNDRCRMIGWTENPAPIYAGSDLTILPSEFEGSPNAILESIAHGTPVFGAQSPGIEEMLPPELLFDPNDIMDAVNRIRAMMNDIATGSRLSALAEKVRGKYTFDWENQAFEILERTTHDKQQPAC